MSTPRVIPPGAAALTARPLTTRDLPQAARLALEAHLTPWIDWISLLMLPAEARRGWVAEAAARPVGFLLCTVSLPRDPTAGGVLPTLSEFFRGLVGRRAPRVLPMDLTGLCVALGCSRPAVERILLEQLEQELRHTGDDVHLVVPESNLPAQRFLREAAYRATQVLRGYFGSEDGYLMVSPSGGAPSPAGVGPSRRAEAPPVGTDGGVG
jgi:ribosomal protein S18 acetylase RimI-like enzyme